jgi:TonB family protein
MRWILGSLFFLAVSQQMVAQDATTESPTHRLNIYAPKPEYSFEARSHWLEGKGLFVLSIRPDGTVESVNVAKSTGHSELDESAVAALRQWRFKPGSVTKVKMPMEFTLAGLRPRGIDSALQAEKQGSHPPGRNSTWREYWEKCISAWDAYHRPDYGDYFRRHRKALGLQDLSKP